MPPAKTDPSTSLAALRSGREDKLSWAGRRDASVLFRLGNEPVSHAADGQQMTWCGGIVLDVTPQADDKIIDGPGVGVLMQSPYFLEYRLAGDHSPLVLDEMA